MSLVGHRTQAIYQRYAITDSAMLRDAGEKLAAFHEKPTDRSVGEVRPFGR